MNFCLGQTMGSQKPVPGFETVEMKKSNKGNSARKNKMCEKESDTAGTALPLPNLQKLSSHSRFLYFDSPFPLPWSLELRLGQESVARWSYQQGGGKAGRK